MSGLRNLQGCLLVSSIIIIHIVMTTRGVITYGCHPNGTLVVNNPEPAKFRYAVAVEFELIGENAQDATNIRCELSWQENRTKIVIQENGDGNCHRGQYIQLTLSTVALPQKIIVKPEEETETYRLRCTEVPEEGITVTVVQEFNPILALFDLPPEMIDAGVLPNFEGSIHSAMRRCCDYRTNPPIFSADVGSHLHWTLDVYREFYLLPIECVAYSGLTTKGHPEIELYRNGCSMDSSLTHFNTTDQFDNIRMYIMDFYVFHFYNSAFITIECSVKICAPDMEADCNWNENCGGSRKRDVTSGAQTLKQSKGFTKTRMTLQVLSGLNNADASAAMDTWTLILVLFMTVLRL